MMFYQSGCGDFKQGILQALHFIQGVVMHRADAQHADRGFQPQPFADLQGVVVAAPGVDFSSASSSASWRGAAST